MNADDLAEVLHRDLASFRIFPPVERRPDGAVEVGFVILDGAE